MRKISKFGLKIVIVGDEEVGKTSIILKYTKNCFTEDYKQTLGADFATKEVKYNGDDIILYLWDIGGKDRYKDLHKYYFEGTNVFLLIFDLTSRTTFENAMNFWLKDIQTYCGLVPIIFVGNKNDLNDQRQVFLEQMKRRTSNLITLLIETSAKTGYNIENLFLKTIELLESMKEEN